MPKVKYLFIPLLLICFFCVGQSYKQASSKITCNESSMLSIYATSEDVDLLDSLLKKCDKLEYLRIKGFIEGAHWNKLFTILEKCARLKGIELFYNDGLKKLQNSPCKKTILHSIFTRSRKEKCTFSVDMLDDVGKVQNDHQ